VNEVAAATAIGTGQDPLGTQPAPGAGPAALRRTFAIISHPDAGKTTLTEKLLLCGGAIRSAGQVRARGERRRTRSDWMAIEQERGISVTSSVLTFAHQGILFNLLDTPGHEDFSEDTYRTLTAVDSAIMVIDAAKGIESQTRKLFEICRLRDIPIVTYVNKVDREGRDPFALLDEIEDTLALEVSPLTWPLGMGVDFHGCYHLREPRLLASRSGPGRVHDLTVPLEGIDDPRLDEHVPEPVLATFRENAELALSAYPEPDVEAYRGGHRTLVVFGSALKGYAVPELLATLARAAPPPRPQPAAPRRVEPNEERVTGFVFKVHANMDPKHRDRVAFVRLCSGRFRRGMTLRQVRGGRRFAVRNPVFFFAQDRELAEEAVAGDIIGIPNHGTLRVGDTLTDGEDVSFTGIPSFAPEILRGVRLDDPMRTKQLRRALEDLAEEGVTQVFRRLSGAQWLVGAVGQLQLDVLKARIGAEYGVEVGLEPVGFTAARWLSAADRSALARFSERHRDALAEDRDGAPVFLARSAWELNRMVEKWPELDFASMRERS